MAEQRGELLAMRAVDLARERIMSCLPYLNLALLKMPTELRSGGRLEEETIRWGRKGCTTDGKSIFWETADVLRCFSAGENVLCRTYLHMVMHCVFLHPFAYERTETLWWDTASDIAVEHVIRHLGKSELQCPEDFEQQSVEEQYLHALPEITAEEVYRAMENDPETAEALLSRRQLFARDSHDAWLTGREENTLQEYSLFARPDRSRDQGEEWRRISENVRILENNASDRIGRTAGQQVKEIPAVEPAYEDYAALLREMAVPSEEAQLNPEEFDYIAYTYGLSRYGNMPLVEPIEYREMKKVRELVIAIDTSGSTQGNKVRHFLSQTYAILNQTECFSDRLNVHIIQCDCAIQHDEKITSRDAFERYMKQVVIKGAGGTDFRPLFTYVQELILSGEFGRLQGIIYFTDGFGEFPETDPEIPTAFVLYDTDCEEEKLPGWARHVRLKGE